MIFADRAPIEKVRRLADGRIAAVAKFARSGVQTYTGAEVGRPDLATVNVYRPESEVFDEAAMASFAHKTITLGHPSGGVTIDNWKRVAAGWTEGKVARDGDYVEIPLMLADAEAIRAYDSGEARELSGGYACELVWGDGIAPDGTRYQATQRKIRGDHIAQVPKGRAGEKARIGDNAVAPASYVPLADRLRMIAEDAAAQHARKMEANDAAVAQAIASTMAARGAPAHSAGMSTYDHAFSRSMASARYQVDGSKLVDMAEGSTRTIGATASANAPTHDAGSARASINAIRAARYSGK